MAAGISDSPCDLSTLYIEHHNWLHGWLRRKLGDHAQAQDLAHDTFVQLLGARTLPPLVEPRAYLTTIAKRTLFDFWRRRDLEHAYLDALAHQPQAAHPSEEQRYAALQALQELDRLLASLPPKARHVFLLNQIQELTYREIGEQLGLPLITVRRYMARAIEVCCAHELGLA
ncbi:sigma-70 family RNA polymerase sigma factor [Acidovorax sp. CCYZU-2555]|uniref:sigma-70 family RNA polymerase sigma factor n=1 Tax=Acidovorax sp. CCYZU-2555 TaxID=2835042 RepID=UPI001BCDBB5F|nr:sigma-70 family RNA polymerase sigma factor [Acidovorax sp. CCYZU-2555]MBS7777112.1 sigma-70 family RNA polymerase sigma factor [Acidovorax sp. CCYZU-2555]